MRPARSRWRAAVGQWAIAASVVLAVLLAWQHRAASPHAERGKLIAREAQGMTREYRGALQVITTSAKGAVDDTQALRELDRSAAQIQAALERDPDARFLLERLQHTYALRLALTQRAAMS
jgi:negative regulator of sigma E activity